MDVVVAPFLKVIIMVLGLYMDAIFIWVIMSWLTAFNVINNSNKLVYMIQTFLDDIIKPATNKIRQFIPPVGGIDISPIFLIFAVVFVQEVLTRIIFKISY